MKHPDIEVLFEDDHIVVISKPSGLLSIPDRYRHQIPSAKSILQRDMGEIYTVHRLDRETSGIMVFARNPEAHESLNRQFMERSIEKSYLLLVHGVSPTVGRIDVNISFHPGKNLMIPTKKGGKESLTEYETIDQWDLFSLVRAQLHTGRTHQLRLHFQYIGHEIVGDSLYGTRGFLYLSQFKKKYRPAREKEEKPLMERLALHAENLILYHPVSNEKMEFNAPLPKDFRASIRQLKLNRR